MPVRAGILEAGVKQQTKSIVWT